MSVISEGKSSKSTPGKEQENKRKSDAMSVSEKGDPKRVKIGSTSGTITGSELPEGSLARSLKDVPVDEANLAVTDMMRFVAGRATGGPNAQLKRERDDTRKLAEKLTSENKKLQQQLKSLRSNGPLSPEYPSALMERVMKTKDFEKLFAEVTKQARQLGQCECLKDQVVANPELEDHGLPSADVLDQDIAEDKRALKKLFLDSVRDGDHRFALLEHLKGLPYLPDIEQLKSIDVDFNEELPEEMRSIPVPKVSRERKERPKYPIGDEKVPPVRGGEGGKSVEEAAAELNKDATNDNVSPY